jgi:hypothetical protein
MLRRTFRVVRGFTLAVSAALALLAGVCWLDVALNDKFRQVLVVLGERYSAYLNYGWFGESSVYLRIEDMVRDLDEQEWWRWQSRDAFPGAASLSIGFGHICMLVPLWAPLAVFGTWPLVAGARFALRRRRLRHRRKLGLCLHCGYDLRGSESPRCPECGTTRSAGEPLRGSA